MKAGRVIGLTAVWLALAAAGYFAADYFGAARPPGDTAPAPINVRDIDIALPGLDGEPRKLATWAGNPMVINVWGTWCAPCRREIPLLESLQAEHASTGLTIVGIAIDDMASVQEFVAEDPFNYPILVGEEDGAAMVSALGVTTTVVPVTAFVDRTGLIRRLHLGEIHRDEAEFALEEILAP